MSDPVTARRLNRERLVLLGWPRAILLQMAHPLIAAGVADHSTFRGGAAATAARMRGTIGAMLDLTFGDEARREVVLSRIRGIHDRVHGTLAEPAGRFAAGTPYAAGDPALLCWVHATLLDSIAGVYQHLVAPLTRAELDAFCAESAPTLIALGGDPRTVPRTWRSLADYVASMQTGGVLAVTPAAREIAGAVLSPRLAGLPVPCGGLHRLVSIGLLPSAIRDAYGFPWDETRARRLARVFRVLRAARRVTPDVLATWSAAR